MRPDRRRPRARPPEAAPLSLSVTAVGAGGDGVAMQDGVRHFVPHALPGETVIAVPRSRTAEGVRCSLLRVEVASPRRVEPFCPVFGRCGGCAFQHWRREDLAAWKRERVVAALRQRGFAEPPVAAVLSCPEKTRRRATLALKDGRIGFSEAASHAVVAVETCPVLRPELARLIAPLRRVLAPLTREAAIALTWTDSGADVLVRAAAEPGGWEERQALADFAAAHDLARLSWDSGAGAVPVAAARPPAMRFGGVAVGFPEAAFLQPSAEGEAALRGAVLDALGEAAHVADLFCGLGTFALPIACTAERVAAADADGAAVAALQAAVAANRLAKRISVAVRDLFREPLTAAELSGLDAVVFDPPRAGAAAQAKEIAASDLPLAVAVSCNPATFARDARILADGGFSLVGAIPVDQFPLSPHLEVVATFRR
jgi:23S rRNA (uracil1939-C5)-methyltransferase